MGLFKCTVLAALAALLQSTDAAKGPWNTAGNWPSGSPWWDEVPQDIDAGFVLPPPWSDAGYSAPDCFNADIDAAGDGSQLPSTFDAQRDCPLCKGLTESTPGFAADPVNCQKYYICEKYGDDWTAYHMTCPACTFWNQVDLTCAQVDSCPIPTFQDGPTMFTPSPPKKLITCLTFDQGISGTKGVWVMNDGVVIVPALPFDNCVYGSCGYFDGSARLEVPRFSNSWSAFSSFAISLFVNQEVAKNLQGIISNDCYNSLKYEPGNSVYVSSNANNAIAGMKAPGGTPVESSTSLPFAVWTHLVLNWDGQKLSLHKDDVLIDQKNFDGPIRRSPEHCPLVVGSFILDRVLSYFTGYLDEVCFFKQALSAPQITAIKANPPDAYDM